MSITRLTDSADDTSWVDALPGDAGTGYVAQNTNISARSRGMDSTTVEVSGTTAVVVKLGGVIDVDGVPFQVGADQSLTLLSDYTNIQYIKVAEVVGDPTLKDLEITDEVPTWDSAKNAYTTSTGERVLKWRVSFLNGRPVTIPVAGPPVDTAQDSLAGAGVGSNMTYTADGTYEIPVVNSGVYEVTAIGSGQPSLTPDFEGGGGGGCGSAWVRLFHGEVITATLVGGDDTTATVGGFLAVTGIAANYAVGGGGSVSGSRARIRESTHTGGDGGPQENVHAGGAGPRFDGADGISGGASRFEGAGAGVGDGETGAGAFNIKYVSA